MALSSGLEQELIQSLCILLADAVSQTHVAIGVVSAAETVSLSKWNEFFDRALQWCRQYNSNGNPVVISGSYVVFTVPYI